MPRSYLSLLRLSIFAIFFAIFERSTMLRAYGFSLRSRLLSTGRGRIFNDNKLSLASISTLPLLNFDPSPSFDGSFLLPRSSSRSWISGTLKLSRAFATSASASSEDDARLKLTKLNDEIARHDYLYYVTSSPEISDAEYDKLVREAASIEGAFPALRGIVKKLDAVGAPPDEAKFQLKTYTTPMLSLQNVYSTEELDEFLSRLQSKFSAETRVEYVVEPKIDGVSLSLEYVNGKLRRATTRGNGRIGEDVTETAIASIDDIPTELPSLAGSASLEVRGEVYMRSAALNELNSARTVLNTTLFSNPRNAASGILRRKSSNTTESANSESKKWLNFFAYSIVVPPDNSTNTLGNNLQRQSDILMLLQRLGFQVALIDGKIGDAMVLESSSQVLDACSRMQAQRHDFPYETDGAVVKVNQASLQAELGATNKFPRWATAFKFPADTAVARLLRVDVQVGRTGVLTPVAILSPVNIGGVIVSRATLHNEDRVNDLFATFDKTKAMSPEQLAALSADLQSQELDVVICRSGDVIPKIISVYDSTHRVALPLQNTTATSTTANATERTVSVYRLPSTCPCCGAATVRELPGVAVRCSGNKYSCSAQRLESISHFCSRDAADIKGLGPEKLAALIEMGMVKTPYDLYSLAPQLEAMLAAKKPKKKASKKSKKAASEEANETSTVTSEADTVESPAASANATLGWGPKSVANLLAAIDKSRSLSSARFLYALGQQFIGLNTAQSVVSHFGGFKAFWDFAQRIRDIAPIGNIGAPDAFTSRLSEIPRISSVAIGSLWALVDDEKSRDVVNNLLTVVVFPASELGADRADSASATDTSTTAGEAASENSNQESKPAKKSKASAKSKSKSKPADTTSASSSPIASSTATTAPSSSSAAAEADTVTSEVAGHKDSLASIIKGNTFVITGSLFDKSPERKTIARSDIERVIRAHGGKIGGSVTSKTKAVICDIATNNAAPSKKYRDAQSRGVAVLDASTDWVQRVVDEIHKK